MRIGFVDQHISIGGGQRFSTMLAQHLAETCPSCQIKLVTSQKAVKNGAFDEIHYGSIDFRTVATKEDIRQWLPDGRIFGIPGTWRIKATLQEFLLQNHMSLERQIQRAVRDVDLTYLAWPYFLNYWEVKTPLVLTLHDLIWKYIDVWTVEDRKQLDASMPLWLAKSNAVITSTEFMAQDMKRFFPSCTSNVHVIHLPATELPPPLDSKAKGQLSSWGIHKPYILCVANLTPHKNHDNLVRAFGKVKQKRDNLLLVCVGPQTDQAFGSSEPAITWSRPKDLRVLACESGVVPGRDIIGLGYVTDQHLSTLYHMAEGVVMPALNEAGSFPILEAAALGVPVACSHIPVYREQDEVYGLQPIYFDPHDPDSIAEALERLVDAPPSAEKLNAIAQQVQARTWRNVAQEYLDVFESVI